MSLYALTTLLSAFLLFAVQPIMGRMIVPWFGGSAAVWLVCLLFFQVVLLAGSLYTHLLVQRASPRGQALIHGAALGASLLALPIMPSATWKPSGAGDPTLAILGLLGTTIGLPYLLLSTTSPLVQAWYADASRDAPHATQPFRLYALSNVGSLLALVSYPFAVEPTLTTRHQALGWSVGYALFVLLACAMALHRWRHPAAAAETSAKLRVRTPGIEERLLWAALPACASLLLLAVTKHLTEDVAPIPLLWVLPLGLYLLSFILCFDGAHWYRRGLFIPLLVLALGGMAWGESEYYGGTSALGPMALFCFGLFVCCMVCHGELQRLRPHARHLTSFYLMVSAGGAAGGVLAAVVAPRVFRGTFELPFALALCAALVLLALQRDHGSALRAQWGNPSWIVALVLTVGMVGYLALDVRRISGRSVLMARNFYGALRVEEHKLDKNPIASLLHGTTTHGFQVLVPALAREPTSYYGRESGIGRVLEEGHRRPAQRVGVIGLGTGTLAAYGREGDVYRFYEINPLVIRLATSVFTFLKDCPATVEIVPGDARLALEREPAQVFGVLAVDAFSSDAIPIHLLTREAFALYARHLAPGGVLAVHITNRYLDLAPVVKRLSAEHGWDARDVDADGGRFTSPSRWILATRRDRYFDQPLLGASATSIADRKGLRTWTDDYSNLFVVMK